MSYFGVSLRNGVGLGLGTVPSLTNTPLSYRLAPSLDLSFAGSDALSPAITFSRTTNATLTNSAGLVANAPMNLLTFSEQFDNAVWPKTRATITANAIAAPDGTVTADKLIANTENNSHTIFRSNSVSGMHTLSVFFKAAEYSRVILGDGSGTAKSVTVNLQTGAVIFAGTSVSNVAVTAAGSGWFRISFAVTDPLGVNVVLDNGSGVTFAGDGVSGIYIWGAQLELGSTATTYNPTTVKNLLGFTEHFDNAAWTKSNAFVQTNLLLQSESLENAIWTGANSSVTANATTAPNGTATADKVIASAGSAQHYILQNVSIAAIGTYTASFYAKSSEYTSFDLWLLNAATADRAVASFNLSAGTTTNGTAGGAAFTGQSSTITDVGNGWYRCTLTATTTGGAINLQSRLFPSSSATFIGNGTDGIYIWGAQLVQGTSAGDYKATYAAAAAVGYTDIYGQPFAQKLVEDTVTSVGHFVSQGAAMTAGTSYTASVYAKQGERRYVFVRFIAGGSFATTGIAIFDLQNGTAVNHPSVPVTATITSVGNGWYRVSATGTTPATSMACRINTQSSEGVNIYTGDGTSGIYIFGAQLSDSASVDPYVYNPVAAPSSVAYYGPRFDYDPVTLAPKGLLIEEQRTNLLVRSEEFNDASWAKSGSTVTANAAVSPDGTANADKLVETATSGTHSVAQTVTVTNATVYTASMYVKAAERTFVGLYAGTPGQGTVFNLTTGAVHGPLVSSPTTSTITPAGNGWYRVSITYTSTATATAPSAYVCDATGAFSYTGNGTSGLFIWGAQLE